MIQQFFQLCLITIIYGSLNRYNVLGYKNDSLKNTTGNNNMDFLILILMSVIILLLCLMISYLHRYYNHSSTELCKQENLSNETNIIQSINDLPNFKAMKPYIILYIYERQAHSILDELIIEAKRTKTFTIVSKHKLLHHDYMLLQVELIQDTQTIIALIEYSNRTDRDVRYFYTLREFFVIIFEQSKIIQTWGNIIELLRPYAQYGLFSLNEVIQSQNMNIQKEFKFWYNRTFRHYTQCQRYLKYDETDGSSCSCPHRPYKSSSNQWSIERAVVYTFDEQLNHQYHGICRCLAITKLAHVIAQNWTIKQLKDYREKHHCIT